MTENVFVVIRPSSCRSWYPCGLCQLPHNKMLFVKGKKTWLNTEMDYFTFRVLHILVKYIISWKGTKMSRKNVWTLIESRNYTRWCPVFIDTKGHTMFKICFVYCMMGKDLTLGISNMNNMYVWTLIVLVTFHWLIMLFKKRTMWHRHRMVLWYNLLSLWNYQWKTSFQRHSEHFSLKFTATKT